MKHHVLSGIDRLELLLPCLQNRRVGLMTNPTGINHQLQSSIDLLNKCCNLTALFAVEHGIRGDIQAGVKVESGTDEQTGIPVYSTYGNRAHFTPEMLDAFDVLVFDIQDVGARFYTYIYSLANTMKSSASAGKPLIVLDRINPLGGVKRCGTVLDPAFASFVGNYALPTQYALTVGEYARYVRDYLSLSMDLTVIPLLGWQRHMLLDDTDLPWVATSPNCPDLATALCYIGTCIFEGSNISEGRGTTQPFQLIGAPFLDAYALSDSMNSMNLPGLFFRPVAFRPTFSKYAGELCHGVQMHITDREHCDCFAGGLWLMDRIRSLAGEQFQFIHWGDQTSFPVDLLLGTDAFRRKAMDTGEFIATHQHKVREFSRTVRQFELYDE